MLSALTQTISEISEQAQAYLEDYYKRKGVGEDSQLRLGFLRDELNQHVSAGLSDEQELAALEYHLLVEVGLVDPEGIARFPEKAQKLLDTLYEAVGTQDTLKRLKYWRKQQKSNIPCASTEEEELRMREFYYLTKLGVLED